MPSSLRRSAIFQLEQLVVRGAHYRFLVVLGVIGLLSVVGGLAVMVVGDAELSSPGDAAWWAFLRLSDTGYLGDDEGFVKRAISSVLTVLGGVVFLGAMVAILTQWLNATLGRLELGLTPIRLDGHVVIVGWTDRTGTAATCSRAKGGCARELMVVVDDIFGAGPSTLSFVKIEDPNASSFAVAAARAAAAGAIAVGVRHGGAGGSLSLAPPADEPLDGNTAELVVLTRTEA